MKQIKVKASVRLPHGGKKARTGASEKIFTSFGAKLIKNLKSFRKKKSKSFKTMFSVLLASASMAAVMSVYNIIFFAAEGGSQPDAGAQSADIEAERLPEENAPEKLLAHAETSAADGELSVTGSEAQLAP